MNVLRKIRENVTKKIFNYKNTIEYRKNNILDVTSMEKPQQNPTIIKFIKTVQGNNVEGFLSLTPQQRLFIYEWGVHVFNYLGAFIIENKDYNGELKARQAGLDNEVVKGAIQINYIISKFVNDYHLSRNCERCLPLLEIDFPGRQKLEEEYKISVDEDNIKYGMHKNISSKTFHIGFKICELHSKWFEDFKSEVDKKFEHLDKSKINNVFV